MGKQPHQSAEARESFSNHASFVVWKAVPGIAGHRNQATKGAECIKTERYSPCSSTTNSNSNGMVASDEGELRVCL
jgi:hypothetical protein